MSDRPPPQEESVPLTSKPSSSEEEKKTVPVKPTWLSWLECCCCPCIRVVLCGKECVESVDRMMERRSMHKDIERWTKDVQRHEVAMRVEIRKARFERSKNQQMSRDAYRPFLSRWMNAKQEQIKTQQSLDGHLYVLGELERAANDMDRTIARGKSGKLMNGPTVTEAQKQQAAYATHRFNERQTERQNNQVEELKVAYDPSLFNSSSTSSTISAFEERMLTEFMAQVTGVGGTAVAVPPSPYKVEVSPAPSSIRKEKATMMTSSVSSSIPSVFSEVAQHHL